MLKHYYGKLRKCRKVLTRNRI